MDTPSLVDVTFRVLISYRQYRLLSCTMAMIVKWGALHRWVCSRKSLCCLNHGIKIAFFLQSQGQYAVDSQNLNKIANRKCIWIESMLKAIKCTLRYLKQMIYLTLYLYKNKTPVIRLLSLYIFILSNQCLNCW